MAIFTALFDVALLVGAPLVGLVIDLSGYLLCSRSPVPSWWRALVYMEWDRGRWRQP